MQDAALEALENKIGRRSLSRMERFCDDYREIESHRSSLMENAPKTLAEGRKQQEAQAEEGRKVLTGQYQEAARDSFKKYAHTIPGFTDSSQQHTDSAAASQARVVSIDPHSLAPEDLGYALFAADALPILRKEFVKLQKENRALKGATGNSSIPGAVPKQKPATEEVRGETLADRMRGQTFTFDPGKV
jgi:hypothetical protein